MKILFWLLLFCASMLAQEPKGYFKGGFIEQTFIDSAKLGATEEEILLAEAEECLKIAVGLIDKPIINSTPYYLDEVDNLKQRIKIIENERSNKATVKKFLKKLSEYLRRKN